MLRGSCARRASTSASSTRPERILRTQLGDAIKWGHRFFELPLESKMTLHTQGPGQTGFMRVGGINPEKNADKAADLKERFIMSRERFPDEPAEGWNSAGQTRWPSEDMLPGFTSFMKAHLAKRVVLAQALARAFALSLDLREDYFDACYRHLGVVSIINYYPPLTPESPKRTQWSFSPHTDYGGFTLLSQDLLGGLQVRNSAGGVDQCAADRGDLRRQPRRPDGDLDERLVHVEPASRGERQRRSAHFNSVLHLAAGCFSSFSAWTPARARPILRVTLQSRLGSTFER